MTAFKCATECTMCPVWPCAGGAHAGMSCFAGDKDGVSPVLTKYPGALMKEGLAPTFRSGQPHAHRPPFTEDLGFWCESQLDSNHPPTHLIICSYVHTCMHCMVFCGIGGDTTRRTARSQPTGIPSRVVKAAATIVTGVLTAGRPILFCLAATGRQRGSTVAVERLVSMGYGVAG